MKHYSITSPTLTGDIVYSFSSEGHLVGVQVNAAISGVACRWVFNSLPLTFDKLKELPINNKTITEL